jgi:hypothetical protein
MAVDFLLQEGGRADLKEAEARKGMTVRILLKIKTVAANKIDTNVDMTVVKQPVEDLRYSSYLHHHCPLGLLSSYTVLLVDSIVSNDINLLLFGNNEQSKK